MIRKESIEGDSTMYDSILTISIWTLFCYFFLCLFENLVFRASDMILLPGNVTDLYM